MEKKTNQDGFTLVEAMVVVAIIGIAGAIGMLSMRTWIPDMRLQSAARDLYGAMMQAKGTAAKLNKNCAITFNQQVAGTPYAYVIYIDTNSNFEFDAADTVIIAQQWPQGVALDTTQGGGVGLSFTDNDDGKPTIAFRPTTIPTANGGGLANGTAFLISTPTGRPLEVVVNPAGSISIKDPLY